MGRVVCYRCWGQNRVALTEGAIAAAKAAGVKHIVLVSTTVADIVSLQFGAQCYPIEKAAKTSGLPYTILRLPFFFENNWFQVDSIKTMGKIFSPALPDVPTSSVRLAHGAGFTNSCRRYWPRNVRRSVCVCTCQVSCADVAAAATQVLLNTSKHVNKTYIIASPMYTYRDLAAAFTASLGKPVEYVQVLQYNAVVQLVPDRGMLHGAVRAVGSRPYVVMCLCVCSVRHRCRSKRRARPSPTPARPSGSSRAPCSCTS